MGGVYMKKILLTLSTALIATSFTTNAYATESDNPELYKTAYSLGANTDFLYVKNYYHNEELSLNKERYEDFLSNCSLLEGQYAPSNCFSECVASGSCVGITLIEVLSHNGVIKPSDIHKNADYLKDIGYDEESDRYITYYQASQGYTLFENYEKYLTSNLDYNERTDRLIKTAEKCMSDGKYFFITIRSDNEIINKHFSHAVCGIGITEGEWTFNEIKYDKCIMTLDSNAVDSEGNPVGFKDIGCIYINSETKQSCIPAYDIYSDAPNELRITSIDDDTLLNYKGIINPSKNIQTDVSKIKHFSCEVYGNKAKIYSINNGKKTQLSESIFYDAGGAASYFIGDSVHTEVREFKDTGFLEGYPTFRYITDDRWINVDLFERPDKEVNIDVDISDNKISIYNYGQKRRINNIQIRMNNGSYGFAPYYWWTFEGELDKSIDIEICDEGVLIKKNDSSELSIIPYYYTLNDKGEYEKTRIAVYEKNGLRIPFCINPSKNVLVSVTNNSELEYYIDDNDDQIYDKKIQQGDVNCDGHIDAVDASTVLSNYAEHQTSDVKFNGCNSLGDINEDGELNAIDASEILSVYAENSVR